MKWTIKLTKKVAIDGSDDQLFRHLETRITKIFKLTCTDPRSKDFKYRPVRNETNLTRVFQPVAAQPDRALLTAILKEYAHQIAFWQGIFKENLPSSENILRKMLKNRKIIAENPVKTKAIEKELRLFEEQIKPFTQKYKIDISLVEDKARPNSTTEPDATTGHGGNDPVGAEPSNGGQLPLPESDDDVSEGPPSQPPPKEFKEVCFVGQIQRLSCQPNVRSEIFTHNKTEKFFLENEAQKKVESDPGRYERTWLNFTTCRGKPDNVTFSKETNAMQSNSD
jgi:hypothetical protein